MLVNYLKIALRHIKKNKGFSVLNILGLSLGLTCAILILLWIQDEITYDKFHKKYGVLYRVLEHQTYEGKIYTFGSTPGLLASAMKSEMPGVKNTTRMGWGERWLFTLKDKHIYENGNYVDPGFFQMFSFDFVFGSPETPLPDDHSIVITERMSDKFFGEVNPVGKYLKVNDKDEFVIMAVVKDPPQNSTIQFDWLASFKIFEKENDWWTNWGNNGMQTFVELKPLTDPGNFNRKFSHYIKSKSSDANAEPLLLPMKDWRLRNNFEEGKQTGGRIETVRLFGVIALLLILIACINFMNLATARSEERSKEVGVRKVMGAQRSVLMTQFMGESIVMSFLCLLIACGLVALFLPFFNDLVSKKLTIGFDNPLQWVIFVSIALLCGVVSGSYPSVYLSSFKPISIFRKSAYSKYSGVSLIRKSLVVIQFVVSIALIICTVVIYKQIDHAKARQLGFNKENVLYVKQAGKINEKQDIIRQHLLATGLVSHASTSNQNILQIGNNTGGIDWDGKDASKDVLITTEYVSPDYLNTAGMKLLQGRDFKQDAAKDSFNVIINETMMRMMGKTQPVGSIVRYSGVEFNVVGLVEDFVFNNMYSKPDPLIFFCSPGLTRFYFVRLKDNRDLGHAISSIESVFKKDNPGYPFEYNFLDDDFDKQFKSEMLVGKLSRLFAIITIIISCLGLFGLAAYTAERRTKEIGIRKVLGASIKNIVSLLSGDFLKLVILAVIIASPIAWYVMNEWLQDYPYRINIHWWTFAAAGSAAIAIALFTVSFQAVKAAVANPVKSLRTE